MLCPECGQQNSDITSVCISCGHHLQIDGGSIDTARSGEGGMVVAMGATNDEEITAAPAVEKAVAAAAVDRALPLPLAVPPERIYASFWYRFLALFIDCIVVGGVQSVLWGGVMMTSVAFINPNFNEMSALTLVGAQGVMLLLTFILSALYFVLCESSSWQATLGKLAIGLKVTDTKGARLSIGRSLGRYCAHFISNLTLGIGYLLNLFTGRQQALHDLIAGTLVLHKEVMPADLELHPRVSSSSTQKMTALAAWVVLMLGTVGVVVLTTLMGLSASSSTTSSNGPTAVERKVYEAEMLGAQASAAVTEYVESHDRFPATLTEAGFSGTSKAVDRIWIDAENGTIYVELGFSPLKKKKLMMVPESDKDGDMVWRCVGENIDNRYLPGHCQY